MRDDQPVGTGAVESFTDKDVNSLGASFPLPLELDHGISIAVRSRREQPPPKPPSSAASHELVVNNAV
jgi:hypothetical protein